MVRTNIRGINILLILLFLFPFYKTELPDIDLYNVTLVGEWEDTSIVKEALYAVGKKLGNATSWENFNKVYKGINLVWGIDGAVGDCKDRIDYACTSTAQQINFIKFYKVCGNRTKSLVRIANRNLIVHELGHAFSKLLNEKPYKDVPLKLLNNKDFYPPSELLDTVWRQSYSLGPNEIFADMFLGWVFGSIRGNKEEWLKENMPKYLNTIGEYYGRL